MCDVIYEQALLHENSNYDILTRVLSSLRILFVARCQICFQDVINNTIFLFTFFLSVYVRVKIDDIMMMMMTMKLVEIF